MDKIQMELFEQLTGLHEIPQGAYNIRANSKRTVEILLKT